MRWLTAGESHGQALSAILEGIPASVVITSADIDKHLARRRLGFGRGARQSFESDKVTILGGDLLQFKLEILNGQNGKRSCLPTQLMLQRLKILREMHR
jgi:Chorismate synthase